MRHCMQWACCAALRGAASALCGLYILEVRKRAAHALNAYHAQGAHEDQGEGSATHNLPKKPPMVAYMHSLGQQSTGNGAFSLALNPLYSNEALQYFLACIADLHTPTHTLTRSPTQQASHPPEVFCTYVQVGDEPKGEG